MRLKDKTALVTGGTSGIGRAVVKRFIAEGAQVMFCGRNEAAGRALAAEHPGVALFVRADVTVEADIQALVREAQARLGRIDCLFNNAAEAETTDLARTTAEGLDRSMWSVFGSVVLMTQAVAAVMSQRGGGSIIQNGSTAAHRGNSSPAVYSALKAAVCHLTRCLALELAPARIRVNAISPGAVATPIFRKQFGIEHLGEEESMVAIRAALAKLNPLKRSGEPEDIAAAAVFFASDESAYVTGQDLIVDGGLTAGLTPFGRAAERAAAVAALTAGRDGR
jgi:NAD(P)-dependent dehydrogenase (short-subunit alcohol dehydrogenase family)